MHGVPLSVTLQRSAELQELDGERIMILRRKKCYFLIIFFGFSSSFGCCGVFLGFFCFFFFAMPHFPQLRGVLLCVVMIKGRRRMSENTRTSRRCQHY